MELPSQESETQMFEEAIALQWLKSWLIAI